MLTEHHIDAAPSRQPVSHTPSEIAEQIQVGNEQSVRRAVNLLKSLWRSLDHIAFIEAVQGVLDQLQVAVEGRPEKIVHYQRKRLDRVVLRATGYRLKFFIGYGSTSEPEYLPSPEEIKAECRRIRAGWTNAERKARWAIPPGWTVPQVRRTRRAAR